MRVTLKQAAERIRRSLPANGGSGVTSALRGGRGKAAVLVPLFEDNQDSQTGGLSVWLTKRSSTKVSTHRGEIAFPGGKAEEKETPEETARREAKEEVGLGSDGRPDGRSLDAVLTRDPESDRERARLALVELLDALSCSREAGSALLLWPSPSWANVPVCRMACSTLLPVWMHRPLVMK